MLVQRLGHQLLARTRLARDHHCHIALAQAANRTKHVLHGRCLAQHFRGGSHALFSNFFTQAFFNRTADQLDCFGQVKRLGQIFKSAALKGRHSAVQVRKRRHDNDRQAWQFLFDFFEQFKARTTRHANVTYQNLRAVVFACIGQRGQHLSRVGKAAGGQVFTQQGFFQYEPNRLVIINNPDGLHAALSLWSSSNMCVCQNFDSARQQHQHPPQGRGIKSLKSVRPGTLSHSIKPWCCCTKVCANVSPSPEPPSRPDISG